MNYGPISYDEVPSSVYRLQLCEKLPVKQVIKILPYLKALGIEGVYCSPYFKAYSPHGYDITDPNIFSPHIGTPEEYDNFCQLLKKLGLKHILDVVPNHMGIKGGQNQWWQDVLENGPYSEYALFFDINWSPDKKELQDRVLLPILGSPYGMALENQEIKLMLEGNAFVVKYADYPLPIAPHTYAMILEKGVDSLKSECSEDDPLLLEYLALIELYRFFPVSSQERREKKEECAKKFFKLSQTRRVRKLLSQLLSGFNGKKRHSDSFDALDRLLEAQFYRLSYWRVASHEINYRRFFNIHELVSIRIEEEKVLESHHRWLFELLASQKIQGLRIDHPDGLYDPVCYFERLRSRFPVLIVVEKILDRKEKLPESWKVDGTVGYEFLNLLNGIFIQQDQEKAFTDIYEEFTANTKNFEEIVYESKKLFTNHEMISEVEALGLNLDRLSETSRFYRDFTRHDLTLALAELIACFPVYRTYMNPAGKISKRDARYITIAIEKAKSRRVELDLDISIFAFLEKILLNKLKARPEEEERYREFVLKFQQLTGPMMAKGFEDTALYQFNRFISLNEVGGDPTHFGHSVSDFHKANLEKKEKWPFGFLATSTHDSKRSEDVRMRLNVLSEIPEKWRLEVKKWAMVNAKHKKEGPSLNAEYFIYQTLLGIWPKHVVKKQHYDDLLERIWQIILKSLREAKQETNWFNPNLAYEESVRFFILSILAREKTNHFFKMFTDFQRLIDRYGSYNSLSQLVLKIASPGIAEFYQGNEILTYRLVDPDNRQPVDFEYRKKLLSNVKQNRIQDYFDSDDFEKVKLALTLKGLNFRKKQRDLFLKGDYLPLQVRGVRKEHVVALARRYNDKFCIVIVGRYFSKLAASDWDKPLDHHVWGDTEILLPTEIKEQEMADLFTEQKLHVQKKGSYRFLNLATVFKHLTVSCLYDPESG